MKSRVLVYLMLLAVAGGVVACTDHLIPDLTPGSVPAHLRVKSLTEELPNNLAKKSVFSYDQQGRLSLIISYQTPDSSVAEVIYNTYSYDAQNRLTGLFRQQVPYPRPQGGQFNLTTGYSYTYNSLNQVTSILGPNYLHWTYQYNSANQLAKSYVDFYHPQISIDGGFLFTFVGKNLTQTRGIIRLKYPNMFPQTPLADLDTFQPTTYTHDNKINPFYGAFVIPSAQRGFSTIYLSPGAVSTGALFGGSDNVLSLSQNNVLSETPPSGSTDITITYQYQYNAANLPTVRIKTITPSNPNYPVSTETLRFEYETY
ncbi:hypothetical protein BH09BAC4_BH09BAC4_51440 [soil metagenome]